MSKALVFESSEKSLWHRANEYMLNSVDHLIRRTLSKLRESCSEMDLEDARFRKIFLAGIQTRSANSYDHDVYYKNRIEPLHTKDDKSMKAIEKPKMKRQLKSKSSTKANDKQSKHSSSSLKAKIFKLLKSTGLTKRNGNSGSSQLNNNARNVSKTVTRQRNENANVISQSQELQGSTLIVDLRHDIEKLMKREKCRGMIFFYAFTPNGLWVQTDEKEPQQRLETLEEFINFLDQNRLDYEQ